MIRPRGYFADRHTPIGISRDPHDIELETMCVPESFRDCETIRVSEPEVDETVAVATPGSSEPA